MNARCEDHITGRLKKKATDPKYNISLNPLLLNPFSASIFLNGQKSLVPDPVYCLYCELVVSIGVYHSKKFRDIFVFSIKEVLLNIPTIPSCDFLTVCFS